MNDKPPSHTKPGESPAQSRRKEREARLAEALRANLKRRKAQERGRNEAPDTAIESSGQKDENGD